MHLPVKLPAGPLIDYWDFCKAIADAVYPTGEAGLEGIDCIVEKLVTTHVSIPNSFSSEAWGSSFGWQSVLTSEDGQTLSDLIVSEKQAKEDGRALEPALRSVASEHIGELTLPFDLTEVDRRQLLEILPELPPLRYPMTDDEAEAFKVAYAKHPRRPMWIPVLVTDTVIARRKAEQAAVLANHQEALGQAVDRGRIVPLSATNLPVRVLSIGTFLSKVHAIGYLEERGLAYESKGANEVVLDTISREQEAVELPISVTTKQLKKSNLRFRDDITEDTRRDAIEYFKSLHEQGLSRGAAKKTAEKFDISEKTLYNWRKAAGMLKKKAPVPEASGRVFRRR